ncbi:hypothetical protein HDU93_004889 [Gonapodya sp. JEL0774]|nr:hypothetical protein HDU93_004889 [Gonapodya sp. JEL0774]
MFRLSTAGFEALVTDSKSVVGHAFYTAELFDEFSVLGGSLEDTDSTDDNLHQDEPALVASFVVSLAVFLECLNMLGDAAPSAIPEKSNWMSGVSEHNDNPTIQMGRETSLTCLIRTRIEMKPCGAVDKALGGPAVAGSLTARSNQNQSKMLLTYDQATSDLVLE